MVIAHFTGEIVPLWTLLQSGLEIGAYLKGKGWVHQGLVTLAREYNLQADKECIGDDLEKISGYLRAGDLVVASVSGGFEGPRRGGHLVVMHGESESQFLVHHPSSWKNYEWPNYLIDKEAFSKSFSERGNIIRLGSSLDA